jgi:heme/copper-type cytochrome/quinol oxidase subunit 1
MSENTTVAIIITTSVCVFGWIVWVIAVNIRRSRSSRHLAEMHSRLLDRFTGNQDLIAFLEGESGRRYFDALDCDVKEPLNRVLNGIQLGIVLVLLGISLIVVRNMQADDIARNALLLIGVPATAVGAGFLISSAISHRLTKSWGLLDKK